MRDAEPSLDQAARHFAVSGGWSAWVGRTAADNDRLSLRLARGSDWWLHAANLPGSHVLLRPPEGGDGGGASAPPREPLLDAALLAAHFSKAREARRARVDWTRARHVGKARGSPPGQVTLARHETLAFWVDRERLERLLAAR